MTLRASLVRRNGGNIGALQAALISGLCHQGIPVEAEQFEGGGPTGDFTICWGWRHGKRLVERGRRVLVMERGYIGDRGYWTSLGWNGLNGRADFCLPPEPMPERFSHYFTMKDWKSGGQRVLIMGQVPGDMSLGGRSLRGWYQQAAALAKQRYGLPTKFRPHPVVLQKNIDGLRGESRPLADDLADAAHVITFNSNSGVDAVLAGVPTVAMDPGSMAWPVTSHRIGGCAKRDRTEWANRVAWCQWSPDELASGRWWERLQQAIPA